MPLSKIEIARRKKTNKLHDEARNKTWDRMGFKRGFIKLEGRIDKNGNEIITHHVRRQKGSASDRDNNWSIDGRTKLQLDRQLESGKTVILCLCDHAGKTVDEVDWREVVLLKFGNFYILQTRLKKRRKHHASL